MHYLYTMAGSKGLLCQHHNKHVSNALCYNVTIASTSLDNKNFSAAYNITGPVSNMWSVVDETSL